MMDFYCANFIYELGKSLRQDAPLRAIIPDIVKVRYFTATYNLPADFLL